MMGGEETIWRPPPWGGATEGGATTTAAGSAVAVVAVAVAAVVVLFLGEKTVLVGGALSKRECVPNVQCSLTENLCIVTPLTYTLSSLLH
jgi:hypothetical protein